MSCSQERSVASEQFRNSHTPKLVKIFSPRYVSGLQRRKETRKYSESFDFD